MLESIRDLMNEETVLPDWLHDIFLGYGDPAAAQYTKLPNNLRTVDFKVLVNFISLPGRPGRPDDTHKLISPLQPQHCCARGNDGQYAAVCLWHGTLLIMLRSGVGG